MLFENRTAAGKALASKLTAYAGRDDVIVLALPRGGVPVAYEVATALKAPLDILIVRKLGVPGHEELALGAIAPNNTRIINRHIVEQLAITPRAITAVEASERKEMERRERTYRNGNSPPNLNGKVVILVDDGLATGASMYAAVEAVRRENPTEIIIAVPVAAVNICDMFADLADDVICYETPDPFYSVGSWYHNFDQTSDEEVMDLLQKAQSTEGAI